MTDSVGAVVVVVWTLELVAQSSNWCHIIILAGISTKTIYIYI